MPAKKKQTCLKPQRNTLHNYFHRPKESLECKSLGPGEDRNQENEQNEVTKSKRKVPSTDNGIDVKFRKLNHTLEEKTKTAGTATRSNPNLSNEINQAYVLMEKINISNSNGKHEPRVTPVVNANHGKSKEVPSTIKRKRNSSSRTKSLLLKITGTVKKNEIDNESFETSTNDSIVIDTSSPLKHPILNQTADYEHESILPMQETTKKYTKSPNEIFNLGKSPINNDGEKSHNISNEQRLPCEEKKKISAAVFKDIIYSFCYRDFSKPYRKLSFSNLPQCCDLRKCKEVHEDMLPKPKEVNSFHYGHVFNILDNPLPEWLCDILPAISLVMSQHQYLRGDMLRVLFDYILNGPNEDLMWEIKTILETHWSLHPSCTNQMRAIYLELLVRRYPGQSFFKTNLTDTGVLLYVMDELEKALKTVPAPKEDCEIKNGTNDDDQHSDSDQPVLTFEVFEERYNNHLPLYDEELQEMKDAVDEMANSSQIENERVVLDRSEILNRLTIALEVIVDLLEADFMICISRLKGYMKNECEMREPLVKHFMDGCFHPRILKCYITTTNWSTWKQISRLIGLVAETFHLFNHYVQKAWKYPNLNSDCEDLALVVSEEFIKGSWDESERLSRLQTLAPPWLRERVTLAVANSQLNLVLGAGIEAVVDIIHMHVISPMKLENDLKKIKPDPEKLKMESEIINMKKKSKKKNQYGEVLLHQVCKLHKFTLEDLECVLSLPETDVNVRDNMGWTPLHEAVNAKSLGKVEMLLQFQPPPGRNAVDVGAQNNDGITALHEAVEANNLEICKLLVQYGGICLLRKKNNEGVTPLMLANNNEIQKFFRRVIKHQEELNLNSNSVLKLSDSMIKMCMVVCDAFIADHHTWEVHQVMKFNKDFDKPSPQPYIDASCKEVLLKFKYDQDHFRKLRRILEKLAENPKNSYLVRLWNDRFFNKERKYENTT